jgi:hypothetical protein
VVSALSISSTATATLGLDSQLFLSMESLKSLPSYQPGISLRRDLVVGSSIWMRDQTTQSPFPTVMGGVQTLMHYCPQLKDRMRRRSWYR